MYCLFLSGTQHDVLYGLFNLPLDFQHNQEKPSHLFSTGSCTVGIILHIWSISLPVLIWRSPIGANAVLALLELHWLAS